jgi:hypothetical protein
MTALCQFEGCGLPESSDRHSIDGAWGQGIPTHAFVAASPAARCHFIYGDGSRCMWDGSQKSDHEFYADGGHPFTPAPVPESTGAQETVTLHRDMDDENDGWAECGEHHDADIDYVHAVATITRRKA